MDVTLRNWVAALIGYKAQHPLLFTGVDFWLFLLVLWMGYLFVHRRLAARNAYLLLFSLLFYYKSCGFFFIFAVFSILLNYAMGLLIGAQQRHPWRKLALILTVTANLGLLAYFKYANFFVDQLNALFGTSWVMTDVLGNAAWRLLGGDSNLAVVILPVGISFYTFQAVSYVVDIYHRRLQALRNPLDFGFYLAFFPQLVAGPIVRATEFIPQMYQPYGVARRELGHALYLILIGLAKKIILSDYIALNLVDRVFANPPAYSGLENLLATYGYVLQIYCDFSGYTDIAIGVALLLGFRLSVNFNFPYRAASLSDFWRRWHISLSTWLRDYLYIPLGGNRHGAAVMWMSLMVTMLLGGLWHGADWTFIVWGAAHGVGLVVSKQVDRLPSALRRRGWFRSVRFLLTFHYVALLWIFFRASGIEQAGQVLGQIAFDFKAHAWWQALVGYRAVLLLMALGYCLHWLPTSWIERMRGSFIQAPLWAKWGIALAVILLLLNVQSADLQPFIYFDF